MAISVQPGYVQCGPYRTTWFLKIIVNICCSMATKCLNGYMMTYVCRIYSSYIHLKRFELFSVGTFHGSCFQTQGTFSTSRTNAAARAEQLSYHKILQVVEYMRQLDLTELGMLTNQNPLTRVRA